MDKNCWHCQLKLHILEMAPKKRAARTSQTQQGLFDVVRTTSDKRLRSSFGTRVLPPDNQRIFQRAALPSTVRNFPHCSDQQLIALQLTTTSFVDFFGGRSELPSTWYTSIVLARLAKDKLVPGVLQPVHPVAQRRVAATELTHPIRWSNIGHPDSSLLH